MKFSEKWLREWVAPQLSSEELSHQLTMSGLEVDSLEAVSGDMHFDIDLTPNRGDCLSIMGVAREVAALNRLTYQSPSIEAVQPQIQDTLPIQLLAPDYCPRYVGRVIKGIKTASTPEWMKEKLESADIRTIHPVVDCLNYVMIEIGQPMHAFDLSKIEEGVLVRYAKQGESITLLDGQEVQLKEDLLVIADKTAPMAIAGIMGGADSGVGDSTQDILLESALFLPHKMAGKARRMSLFTDSAFRFERGVDPDLQVKAVERATALILEICGGKPGPIIDVAQKPHLPQKSEVRLDPNRVQKLLGMEIEGNTIIDILTRLGCRVSQNENGVLNVLPPSFRYDISDEVDLVEEIVRVVGYDSIPVTTPRFQMQFATRQEKDVPIGRLKRALVDLGYQEAITYSFVDDTLQSLLFPEKPLPLLNPISAEMNVMRLSLWPGLLQALQFNQNRQQHRVKFFETGLCFVPEGEELKQIPTIGGVIAGSRDKESWDIKAQDNDFFDLKRAIDSLWSLLGAKESLQYVPQTIAACHSGQCADILFCGRSIGRIGKLHPKIQETLSLQGPAYLFEMALAPLLEKPVPKFFRPSRFPENRRDIAVIVDAQLPSGSLVDCIKLNAGEILKDVLLFDVYSGKGIEEGSKSVALGLILQHASRTLVDKEVDDIVSRVVAGLKKEFGAELRD